jgi:hypothetical protein
MAVRLVAGRRDGEVDRPAAQAHPAWLGRLSDLLEQLITVDRSGGCESAYSFRTDIPVCVEKKLTELRGNAALRPDWLQPRCSDSAQYRIVVVQPRLGLRTIHHRTEGQRCHAFVLSARHELR